MNDLFKKKAEALLPNLHKKELSPIGVVGFLEDDGCYMSTKTVCAPEKEFFVNKDSICLDFGRHITGYFKFELGEYDRYIDAPVRLKIKFGETPYEMRRDFATYNEKGLCLSWLQEEIINIDLKGEVKLPRRYAFRYVEISVIATRAPITLKNFTAEAYTSVDVDSLKIPEMPEEFKKIDKVACDTLSECMQDVFEDGPKRDRRLWMGDLRIQALADYYTFNNTELVKRCLYLFAAFDSEDVLLPAAVYTKPDLETSGAYLVSYALFFTAAVCDYYEHTKDKETAEELYETAKRQIFITEKMLDKNGILQKPEDYGWWTFVDWSAAEGSVTATMGIYIYVVKLFSELCKKLGKTEDGKKCKELSERLKKASLEHLYNGNVFVNEYDGNAYYTAAQVWMVLAGVLPDEECKRILKECIGNKKYCAPVTPYMHHYVTEALIKVGQIDEARQYIIDYWGEMVNLGADTFWEVFVKEDPYCSPYNDALMNSACHAWSCTPTYFIRKYFLK